MKVRPFSLAFLPMGASKGESMRPLPYLLETPVRSLEMEAPRRLAPTEGLGATGERNILSVEILVKK